MVKCSEVLQCSVGLSNKVSNIIRRHIDNEVAAYIFFRFYFVSIYIYIYIYGCIPV